MFLRATALALTILSSVLLTGCDQIAARLGLEDPSSKEAKADAEGRAVGSACRQSGRAIEDCYSIYQWLPKASIFAGWRDMNDYMQANKLDIVEPKLPPPPPPGAKKKKATEATGEERKADAAGKGAEAPAGAKPDGRSDAKPETHPADGKPAESRGNDAKQAKTEGKASAKQ